VTPAKVRDGKKIPPPMKVKEPVGLLEALLDERRTGR
jgi:hypothetical protein